MFGYSAFNFLHAVSELAGTLWVCPTCGSPDIESECWVAVNTGEVRDSTGGDYYCNSEACEEAPHFRIAQTLAEYWELGEYWEGAMNRDTRNDPVRAWNEVERLRARLEEAQECLSGVVWLLDEGALVRDTRDDAQSNYPVRSMRFAAFIARIVRTAGLRAEVERLADVWDEGAEAEHRNAEIDPAVRDPERNPYRKERAAERGGEEE